MAAGRAVITGLGLVNACGTGVDAFWESVAAGRTGLRPISRFDATGFPVRVAGEVPDFDPAATVPRRFLTKTDRFTHFAMVAADEALADAAVDLEREDRSRFGVWMGNNSGGWDLCERGFVEYYRDGPTLVNPWQATAWFPAAPQGFLTIRHGLRGMSKSFAADRASGSIALYYAVRSLEWGHNDVVLAGGCEAPITPLSVLCHHTTGDLSEVTEPATAFRPFDRSHAGLVVGEGAAILVVEEAGHARRRGAAVLGNVLGAALGTSLRTGPERYARLIGQALRAAGCGPADIDLVLCEGCGVPNADRMEAQTLELALGRVARRVPVSAPKCLYGHLYGASGVTEAICGLLAIRHGFLPPTPAFEAAEAPLAFEVVRSGRGQEVRRVLLTSCARDGQCVALVVGAPEGVE